MAGIFLPGSSLVEEKEAGTGGKTLPPLLGGLANGIKAVCQNVDEKPLCVPPEVLERNNRSSMSILHAILRQNDFQRALAPHGERSVRDIPLHRCVKFHTVREVLPA